MPVVTHLEVWSVYLQSVTITLITCTKDQLGLAGQPEHLPGSLVHGNHHLKHQDQSLDENLHDGVPALPSPVEPRVS